MNPDKPPTMADMAKHAHVEAGLLARALADISNALDMQRYGATARLCLRTPRRPRTTWRTWQSAPAFLPAGFTQCKCTFRRVASPPLLTAACRHCAFGEARDPSHQLPHDVRVLLPRSRMLSVLGAPESAAGSADGAAEAAEAAEQAQGLPEMPDLPQSDGILATEAAEQPECADEQRTDAAQPGTIVSAERTIKESSARNETNAAGAEATAGAEAAAGMPVSSAADVRGPMPSAGAKDAVDDSAAVAEVRQSALAVSSSLTARHALPAHPGVDTRLCCLARQIVKILPRLCSVKQVYKHARLQPPAGLWCRTERLACLRQPRPCCRRLRARPRCWRPCVATLRTAKPLRRRLLRQRHAF